MEMQKSYVKKRDRSTSLEIGEGSERKFIKMRQLRSLLDAKGAAGFREEKSQATEEHTMSIYGSPTIKPKPVTEQLDLNSDPCTTGKLSYEDIPTSDGNPQEEGSTAKCKNQQENIPTSSRGLDFDLNAEDVASSVNRNSFHPYKRLDNLKSTDVSECASSTGPLEDHGKDPFKIWKEMKQNGFMSSSSSSFHGGIPVPKQRGRRNKNEMLLKRRVELAKKEQADRFAMLAAPSGLLNELNPGIINHVRNKKQVHSIIEALVNSEKPGPVNRVGNRKETGNYEGLGMNWHKRWRPMPFSKSSYLTSDDEDEDGGSTIVQKLYNGTLESLSNPFSQDDTLALKMSSSLSRVSEMSMSNNGSTLSSVTSLSVKAATVASQWLELLHQDIKGRLSALRRSKKRVQAVIGTELPFLLSKEFSVNPENEPSAMKNEVGANCTASEMHRVKWSALFGQMDKALVEEEQQLEIWLNQVKEMQLHCEHGLQNSSQNAAYGLQNLGTTSKENVRSGIAENSEREVAVRAAAASIYSTCNFLLSKGDVSCF